MASEKFCLRWNDFESNISVAFREIREEKDFFDCTLSCGARQIQAHKLILSACSPFFRSILRQNPHQHPLLYLKGIQFTDLQAVLNFMYHGEVNVAQEELNSFLSVAEDLQVKGLTQKNVAGPSNATEKHKPSHTPSSMTKAQPTRSYVHSPKPSNLTATHTNEDDDVQEVVPVIKQELPSHVVEPPITPKTMGTAPQAYQQVTTSQPSSYQENTVAQIEESYSNEGYDYGGFEGEVGYEEESFVDDIGAGVEGDYSKGPSQFVTKKIDGTGFSCQACGKSFKDWSNCRRHVKSVHFTETPENCPVCEKVFKNKNSLKHHIRIIHTEFKSLQETHKIWM